MASGRKNRKRESKAKYILLLILVGCILIFSLGLLLKKQDDREPVTSEQTTTIQTTAAPTDTAAETTVTTASQDTTEHMTLATKDIGSGHTVSSEVKHIYIRVNHEKEVKLPQGFSGDISWSISDKQVADVDENGLLTGLQKGKCTLTASCGDRTVEIPVTVREMVVEDNCTYVDGILVANKSYSLPREYDPGLLPVTKEAFEKLSAEAKAQGLDIHISSDYRDYDFQVTVYNSMVDGYSKEYADSVSARPGHSEHQTGYTIDCNTIDNTFADTAEGKWLRDHCWEYGFIIRYPEDKVDLTGYSYESWHIRYVGVEHAKEIWEQGICLEEYLDIDSVYDSDNT